MPSAPTSRRATTPSTRVQGRPVGAADGAPHRPSSRCAADAARHEVAHRGDAGAGLLRRRADGPRPWRARRRGESRRSARRPADPCRQGLVHGDIGQIVASTASRSMAALASSRRPARRSICATPASPPSTKARPASRPMIWSGARSHATRARRPRASSRICATCFPACRVCWRRWAQVWRRASMSWIRPLLSSSPETTASRP